MSKEIITQEIRNLMEVISEQQELVLSRQGKIPQIEMDILMGNVRKLYERLMELNKVYQAPLPVTAPVQEPAWNIQPEELIASVAIPEPEKKINLPEVASAIPFTGEKEEQPVPEPTANASAHVQPELMVSGVDTPVTASSDEVISEAVLPQAAAARERAREFGKPATRIATTVSLFDDAPTIADKFQGTPTLYDKIASSKEDKSLAGKMQKHPVSDLKKSIGINEKFAFINELFDGDLDGYNKAIELLNNSKHLDDAMEVLSASLASKYGWSEDGASFLQLKNLVERRFGA